MTAEPAPAPRRSHRLDLLWIAAWTLATYVAASRLQLYERFGAAVTQFERFQLDELLFTLMSLAAGLGWYAYRRQREAERALQRSRQAQVRVTELLAHNRVLAQQVLTAQERERLELARELHDDLGQCCNAISVEAAVIARADGRDVGAAQAGAARIAATAADLYARVHALLRKLRPADLDALGLLAAIQALAESWQTSSGIGCDVQAQGSCDDLGPACQIAVYRVAQEALSNVVRHAGARQVRLVLRRLGSGELRLEVRDDGRGFDAQAPRAGFGLLGASERAAALGGELGLDSGPGRGTTLTLRLPAGATAT